MSPSHVPPDGFPVIKEGEVVLMMTLVKQLSDEKQLIDGLQNVLAWKRQGDDLCRELSSLAIVTRSFQSHMERLMSMEERDGNMETVLKEHPDLNNAVEVLRQEHDNLRRELGRVLYHLEHFPATGQMCLTQICDNMTELLRNSDDDDKNESDMFHEAFERDVGGEG
jgi:hypothetical protein